MRLTLICIAVCLVIAFVEASPQREGGGGRRGGGKGGKGRGRGSKY